jgi:hypothetical protein
LVDGRWSCGTGLNGGTSNEDDKGASPEQERTKKWLKMKKHWQRYGVPGRKHEKVLSRVRKGIPDCLRGFAWYQLCGAESIKQKIPDPWKLDMSTVSPVTIDDVRIPAPTSKYDVMLYYTDFTECRLDET